MSLIKATPGLFENYTFIARPSRTFSSSSSGVTGAVRVFPKTSTSEKYIANTDSYNDENLDSILERASTGSNVSDAISKYMDLVSSSSTSPRRAKQVEVLRFEPSFQFTSDTVRKDVVRNILYPYYATAYPSSYWGFTNYLSLNFMSGSWFNTGSALIYANPTLSGEPKLTPSGAFTFEFYVKPTMRVSGTYRAGTVMHVSSSFAISIVSGSEVDPLGRPDSFRVMLQLSHSADIPPSNVDLSIANNARPFPSDLVFLSEDLIGFNGWHHISMRWGGSNVDFGSGSFFIDGVDAGDFCVPSGSVTNTSYAVNSNALFIGNYYNGPNAGSNRVSGFFNEDAAAVEGFTDPFTSSIYDIPAHKMSHPFGGELHELRVWKVYRALEDIVSGTKTGVSSSNDSLKFYLGPHFVHESPTRSVLYTPFQSVTTSTNTPYAKEMSFGVGGHLINAENHLRDAVSGYYPRLLHMTASEIDQTNTSNLEASQFLFATSSIVQRNLLVLPCDNGKFFPRYDMLVTSSETPYYRGSPGMVDLSEVITNENNLGFDNQSMVEEIAGASPTNLSSPVGSTLTIYQRTKDPSSNLVTFFDASNLFYGSKIHPGSYELVDPSFTGSAGLLPVKIKDNGLGGLYRADASTPHAKWNTVGTLMYEEGLAVITSPYLGELFGKDSFTVSFKGEHSVPLLTTNVKVPAYQINSSSMPSYLPLTASDYANEVGDPIVYISRINFHDENLNVVARAELAQPVAKRLSDKFVVKVKFDF